MNRLFIDLVLQRKFNQLTQAGAVSQLTTIVHPFEWDEALAALTGQEETVRELKTILKFLRDVEKEAASVSPKLDSKKEASNG